MGYVYLFLQYAVPATRPKRASALDTCRPKHTLVASVLHWMWFSLASWWFWWLFQCPMFKIEEGQTVAEPFAEEAKYFAEVRLLQRDVKIVLEGASNQNLLGTVLHPVIIFDAFCYMFSASLASFSLTTWVSQHHSGFWCSKRWRGGSGISWTIC